MINKSHKVLVLVLLFTSSILSYYACKNPKDGFELGVKSNAVTASSTFRIVDAFNGNSAASFEGSSVQISGRDANLVYSDGGYKAVIISGGVIRLALLNGAVATEASPIQFNIVVNINGYFPVVYPVSLISTNPITETITLASKSMLPSGAKSATMNLTSSSSGAVGTATTATIPSDTSTKEAASLTIDSGTVMLDASGNPVTGSVTANIYHFTGSKGSAYSSFPGNQLNNLIKDSSGTALPQTAIAPVGWLNINMSNVSSSVKTFSKPVKATVEIPDNFYNPVTGASYKAGDQISVISKDELGTNWTKEGTATITLNSNNKLQAIMNITHLSDWTLAQIIDQCVIKIPYTYDKSYGTLVSAQYTGTAYYYSYSTANVPYDPLTIKSFTIDITQDLGYFPLQTSSILYVSYLGNGGTLNLIYRLNTFPFSLVASADFSHLVPGCDVSLTPSDAVKAPMVNALFRAKCLSGSISYVILPAGTTIYVIDESVYQDPNNYVRDAQNNVHKVAPLDNVNGVQLWTTVSLNQYTDKLNNMYNQAQFLKSPLNGFGIFPGKTYRFAFFYNAARIDYVYIAPSPIPDQVNIDMDVNSCN